MHIVKGCPRDKWEEVQAIQHEPFVYIMGNGSRWAGSEEGDISELLDMLAKHTLDVERFKDFWSVDPCSAMDNPDWHFGSELPRWIDGERLYAHDGVYRFFGNFLDYSHGFSIDTNDRPTIDALTNAIRLNVERAA